MKTLRLLSFFAMIIIIVTVIFALPEQTKIKYTTPIKVNQKISNAGLKQRMTTINQIVNQSSQSGISENEYNLKISELLREIDKLKNQIEPSSNSKSNDIFLVQKFWIKLIFSGFFSIAALYIILSNKYKDDTKKWALSVLTLIAGVWIGTVS